jgi:pimeloyl-ACP methyl ester carboxylesterase
MANKMRTRKWGIIGLIFLAVAACKTAHVRDGASTLRAFSAPDSTNTAVVLIHGWGKTPRRPTFIWRLKIRPYTDLSALRDQLKATGFTNVNVIDYDDELSLNEMAKTVTEQIQGIIAKANNPNLKLDVIGHSLGQFVALKSILENPIAPGSSEKIVDRVRLFVGLAGAVRGQDVIRPCRIFPNQCGGAEVLSPYYSAADHGAEKLKEMFSANHDAINRLKKCSIYARADEIVDSPYNAGSFANLGFDQTNLKDIEINYNGSKFHKDVKDSSEIIRTMLSVCYEMLGQG